MSLTKRKDFVFLISKLFSAKDIFLASRFAVRFLMQPNVLKKKLEKQELKWSFVSSRSGSIFCIKWCLPGLPIFPCRTVCPQQIPRPNPSWWSDHPSWKQIYFHSFVLICSFKFSFHQASRTVSLEWARRAMLPDLYSCSNAKGIWV